MQEQRLPVHELRVGMFVAELDRPWLDTPFLLQGFLIENEATLAQLCSICEYVVIDRARSIGLPALSAPAQNAAQPAESVPRVVTSFVRVEEGAAPARTGKNPDTLSAETTRTTPSPSSSGAGRPVSEASSIIPSVSFAAQPAGHSHAVEDEGSVPAASSASWPLSFPNVLGWLRTLWSSQAKDSGEASADSKAWNITSPLIRIHKRVQGLDKELMRASQHYAKANEVLQNIVRDIRLGKGLEIEAVESVVEDLVESILRNPGALQLISRLRDANESAYGHALQIGVLLVSFGRELGFARAELAQLGQIGLLFDIGKLRVSPALLNKQGSLTSEEFDAVKLHVQYSLEMIGDSASVNEAVMKGVAQHHERLNGSGYPKRLRGTQIETFGRMAGIVDCFAAMTSLRPYADPLSAYDAMRLLQKWADTYFNAGLIQQFIQAIGIFPVGTLVELSTGEAAVIIEQHRAHRLKPKVLVITDTNGAALKVPIILDLLYGTGAYADSLPHIRRGLPAEAVGAASAEFYLSHL